MVKRTEVAFQRHRRVVDLAAEPTTDRRQCIACVHRKVFDDNRRDLTGLAVAERHRSVGDRDIADREAPQRCAGWGLRVGVCRGRQRRKFPVALAARIGFERNRRPDQLEADDLEALVQQRQQLDLRLDVLGRDHLWLLAPRRVAERDVVEHQLRLQTELEIDSAANRQVAPGRLLDALLDGTDEFLDVDGTDRNRNGDQQQQDDAAQHR